MWIAKQDEGNNTVRARTRPRMGDKDSFPVKQLVSSLAVYVNALSEIYLETEDNQEKGVQILTSICLVPNKA